MAFKEFWEGQSTKMQMLSLCEKIKKELTIFSAGVDEYVASYDGEVILQDYLQSYEEDYDQGLVEAIAGNASGFVSVAEKQVTKKNVFKPDGSLNNYLIALKEMGFPSFNSFLYSKLVRAKDYKKAVEYLNLAVAQNEPGADYFQACEFIRKGKKGKGLKILKKIMNDKNHPFAVKALAIVRTVFVKPEGGLIFMGVLAVLGVLFFLFMFAASGEEELVRLIVIGSVVLCYLTAKLNAKWKYSQVKDYVNFDKIMLQDEGVLFGAIIDCSNYVRKDEVHGVLSGAYADPFFDIEAAGTSYTHQDLTDNSSKQIASIRYLISQIHDARIAHKGVLMRMCKEGDFKAQIALRVMFDTEYKDGGFVVNKQANPCPFIPPVTAQVIDD